MNASRGKHPRCSSSLTQPPPYARARAHTLPCNTHVCTHKWFLPTISDVLERFDERPILVLDTDCVTGAHAKALLVCIGFFRHQGPRRVEQALAIGQFDLGLLPQIPPKKAKKQPTSNKRSFRCSLRGCWVAVGRRHLATCRIRRAGQSASNTSTPIDTAPSMDRSQPRC